MSNQQKIANALLFLRLGVFIVILMWTLDKFVNPGHAAGVFENFYGLSGWGPTVFMIIGALESILLIGFVIGFKKRLTYGLIFLIHAVSTLSSWKQYINPFDGNLLFFAAIPMLAACWALYSLRELDTRFSVD
ncbi:MAG: hypothetical protein KGY53_04250 [Wenzhouxiangellaceae bacterium]|nr:hypothetical protein [Wenzhouxiangellaceae bacterium]MBS3823096.1 hypothetical protein [Wenzhouxiangellaceae bacterium]